MRTTAPADHTVAVETEASHRQRLFQLVGGSAAGFDLLGFDAVDAGFVSSLKRVDIPPLRRRGVSRRGNSSRCCQNQQDRDDRGFHGLTFVCDEQEDITAYA